MKTAGQGEFGLLDRIRPYLAPAAGGDDAVAMAPSSGFLVTSCDMFVEGIHFDLSWMTAEDAGWRALALALGDLAAKGAAPRWALTSLAMPATWDSSQLMGLYAGMSALARKVGMEIIGGDMSAITGPTVLSITVAGESKRRPLQRSEAQRGWSVGVTGPLGASAMALRERRALRIEPRLDAGMRANASGLCCGDISDGLVREMEKFSFMSGVGCVLNASEVPIAQGATLEEALTSGEEPELVCAGPLDIVRRAGLRVVGELTETRSVQVIDSAGAEVLLSRSGYDHFA